MGGPKCDDCRFWRSIKSDAEFGDCRRHAPAAFRVPDDDSGPRYYAEWPKTSFDDWCGEFELRPSA